MGKLEEMEAFARTAEAKSFTLAASRLGVSKSVVSQRVAELEARLGTRLINRTTRRLSLTEAGAAFLERSARLLQEVEEAEVEAAGAQSALKGILRITAPLSFSLLHLEPIVCAFLAANPSVTVHIDLEDRHVDLVGEGYDMAVRIGVLADSGLIARRLAPSRVLLCCSPGYAARFGLPATPAELARHTCLIYAGSTRPEHWTLAAEGGWVGVAVSGPLRSNNGDLLLKGALAGLGIAALPTFLTGPSFAAGALVPVLPANPPRQGAIWAVYPQTGAGGRQLPRKVRAFTEFLAERIGKEPYWERGLGF